MSLTMFQNSDVTDKNLCKHASDMSGQLKNLHFNQNTYQVWLRTVCNTLSDGTALFLTERLTSYFRWFFDFDMKVKTREEADFWKSDTTIATLAKLLSNVLKKTFPEKDWGPETIPSRTAMIGVFSTKDRCVHENGAYKVSFHFRCYTRFTVNEKGQWTQAQFSSFVVNMRMMLNIQNAMIWEMKNHPHFSAHTVPEDIIDDAAFSGNTGLRLPFCGKKPRKCKLCANEKSDKRLCDCEDGYYCDPKIYTLQQVYDKDGNLLHGFIQSEGLHGNNVLSMVKVMLQFSIGIYQIADMKPTTLFDVQTLLCTRQGEHTLGAYELPGVCDYEVKEKLITSQKLSDKHKDNLIGIYNGCKHPKPRDTHWREHYMLKGPGFRGSRAKTTWLRCYEYNKEKVYRYLEDFIKNNYSRYCLLDGSIGVWITSIQRPQYNGEEAERNEMIKKQVDFSEIERITDQKYLKVNEYPVFRVSIGGKRSTYCGNLKDGEFHQSSKSTFHIFTMYKRRDQKKRANERDGFLYIDQRCWCKQGIYTGNETQGTDCGPCKKRPVYKKHRIAYKKVSRWSKPKYQLKDTYVECKNFRSKPKQLSGVNTYLLQKCFMPHSITSKFEKQNAFKRPRLANQNVVPCNNEIKKALLKMTIEDREKWFNTLNAEQMKELQICLQIQ